MPRRWDNATSDTQYISIDCVDFAPAEAWRYGRGAVSARRHDCWLSSACAPAVGPCPLWPSVCNSPSRTPLALDVGLTTPLRPAPPAGPRAVDHTELIGSKMLEYNALHLTGSPELRTMDNMPSHASMPGYRGIRPGSCRSAYGPRDGQLLQQRHGRVPWLAPRRRSRPKSGRSLRIETRNVGGTEHPAMREDLTEARRWLVWIEVQRPSLQRL